jgi:hypothetical protein
MPQTRAVILFIQFSSCAFRGDKNPAAEMSLRNNKNQRPFSGSQRTGNEK